MSDEILSLAEAAAFVEETTKRVCIEPKSGREHAALALLDRLQNVQNDLLENLGKLDGVEARAARVWSAFQTLQDALREAVKAGDEPPLPDDLRLSEPHDGIETWVKDLSIWAAMRTITTPAYLHGERLPAKRPIAGRIMRNALFNFYADTWRDPDGGRDVAAFLGAFYDVAGARLRNFASSRLRVSSRERGAWAPPPTADALRKAVEQWRSDRIAPTSSGN